MTSPFFSVVIPTKNRSFLVGFAIESVLRQSFHDVEVVVVDNDDTEQTREAVQRHQDPRVRYFRTGKLPMHENWEFGFRQARGEYVGILEDKAALKTHTLGRVHSVVERERHSVVCWRYDRLYDTHAPPKLVRASGTGANQVIPSEQAIETILNERRAESDRIMPRGLNSCVHRDLLIEIQNGPMGRLCAVVAPDYTMAFQMLAHADHIMHIDEPLVVIGGFRYSVGRSQKLKQAPAAQFVQEVGGQERFYDHVPIKAMIVANTFYNDYERVRSVVGRRLSAYPLNMTNYFLQCHRDLRGAMGNGVDMSHEEAAWEKALSTQTQTVREAVLEALPNDQPRRDENRPGNGMMAKLKAAGKRIGLHRFWHGVKRRAYGNSQSSASEPAEGFANVLEYVEWEAAHRSG